MNEHYSATINWAYSKAPVALAPRQRREWVTDYLVVLKHWAAVEEHLNHLKASETP